MSTRTYPYRAWVLKPSFKPAEVTLTHCYESLQYRDAWDVAEGGKLYSISDLFPTKEAAIAEGWERIHAQEAKLEKAQESINKKRAALAKAAVQEAA